MLLSSLGELNRDYHALLDRSSGEQFNFLSELMEFFLVNILYLLTIFLTDRHFKHDSLKGGR